jgi:hypothetical protein
VKLLKGKLLLPDTGAVDHPRFSWVHSAVLGSASVLVVGQRPWECSSPSGECYSPRCNATYRDRGPRFGEDAGIMVVSGPS